MEISFEIKKRHLYGVPMFVFLFSIILIISAQAYNYAYSHISPDFWGHEGDEVIVTSNGAEKPFQQAISDGDFNGRDLSYFKPTEINPYSFTGTNAPQTVVIVNDDKVKSCLLLKFTEKDANSGNPAIDGPNTCSIYQETTKWKIDIQNADCNVVCLKWDPNPYEP